MVDFRYHLISLIGVILALALGILAGSGFLGGPILEQLQDDVDNFKQEARDLQAVISEQDLKLDQSEDFARAAESLLVAGQLDGEQVVLFQFEGTEGRLADEVRDALTSAGAQIVSQITFSEKLALASAPARDELSLITGALSGDTDVLLEEAASVLGQRAAAAAEEAGPADAPNTSAGQRFESLLAELEASEFVASDLSSEGQAVPADALFVVVGGSTSRPPLQVAHFVPAFAAALTERGAPAIFVESSTSAWELVAAVRTDIGSRARAATVDNAESPIGRISVVLGLARASAGSVGHFGTQQGRTAIIPDPNASV
jgi:hypothetical protein